MEEDAQLSGAEVLAALEFVAAQAATPLESPAVFDEADYLRRHPDVAAAVAQGVVASGYRHFVQSGFGERRVASAASEASFWWTRLLHEVGGLETRVAARGQEIAGLREQVALRGAGPGVTGREAVDLGWLRWGGGTRALPCPICDAGGPHPVVVRASGHVLVRCDGCGTRFYVDRVEHAYEGEPAAAALQFGLEQNASLHHQTRLLFGREGATSVLDVGCGFGFGVDLATEVLGWRAVGVDPSPAAAAGRVQLGADIRVDYLSAATELGAPFDRVVASEVLEHVADPYAMLALLRARLAPGGVLTVTTPNGDAVRAGEDRGRLLGILAPGVHLTLFTEGSLALALRRAGFGHVAVEVTADTLVAEASDLPLGARAAGDHAAAYRGYLEGLMRRAPVGSALWNGAAGRLLTLLMPTAAATVLEALFGEIAAAWQALGIDVETLVLPAALTEAEIRTVGAAGLGEQRPFNLAGVLLHRATLADRAGDAAVALRFAAAAHRIAVETRRVLQLENLIDLDLKRTAWRARLLMAECVGALAPGLAATVTAGIARESPGELADWDDPPAGAVIEMVAEVFVAAVAADRFDEARRVEEWVADADAVIGALAGRPELLLPTLFMRGKQRLEGHQDPAGALRAFERLAGEAQRLGATDYMEMAREHMRLAMTRLGETA
ncbi:MAG: class I SAM-dependent methyltransferase [Janthinobacterium lividum]